MKKRMIGDNGKRMKELAAANHLVIHLIHLDAINLRSISKMMHFVYAIYIIFVCVA